MRARRGLPRGVKVNWNVRFWNKVDKKGEDDCWNWLAGKRAGYGIAYYKGFKGQATHVVWFLTYGVYPTKDLCHTCDNTSCVNPKHLFEGTPTENALDAVKKERMVKYSRALIDKVLLLANAGLSQVDISLETGISQSHVSRVIHNLRRES